MHPLDKDSNSNVPLGPIVRVIEVYFVLAMLTVLGWALLMPAESFEYDITLIRVMVLMTAAARSVWLIEKRSDATRAFVVISMAVVIVLSVLDMVFGGEYERIASVVSWPVLIAGGIAYFGGSLFIIVYFAFSPHAKQVFVIPSENTAKPQKQGTMTEADNVPADVCTGPDRGGPAQSITRRNAGQTVIGKRHLAATNHEIRRIAFLSRQGVFLFRLRRQ